MPIKLRIKLGENVFDVEGDFAFDEPLTNIFRSWVNAQQAEGGGALLDAATAQLKSANDVQAQVVIDNTPKEN